MKKILIFTLLLALMLGCAGQAEETELKENLTDDVPDNVTLNETSQIEETYDNQTEGINEDEEPENGEEEKEFEEEAEAEGIPETEDEILKWLSSPPNWEDVEEVEEDPEKRNFECADDTLLRYDKLKDKTYGIWEIDYKTCGNNKKGNVFFRSLGLKESDNGNNKWEYVFHNTSRGIYQFKNNETGVELMYLISDFPEGYVGKYDDVTHFKNYFASTICRLPECQTGELTRGDVKNFSVNGYYAYFIHNSDWSGIEMAFFATPCQIDRCHNYGLTYIYVSLRGEREQVLETLYEITHHLTVLEEE